MVIYEQISCFIVYNLNPIYIWHIFTSSRYFIYLLLRKKIYQLYDNIDYRFIDSDAHLVEMNYFVETHLAVIDRKLLINVIIVTIMSP